VKNKIIKLALVIFFLLGWSLPAYADSGEFTIYPAYEHQGNKSWIIREASQGDELTEYVILENLSDKPQNLSLALREAYLQNGNFVISENMDYKNLGNWVMLPLQPYALAPHQKIKVPFEIHIPDNTNINKYYGGIFAVKESSSDSDVKIVTRIGVRIYLDVQPKTDGFASVLNGPEVQGMFFFWLSAMGLAGAFLYNLILHLENKKYEKKQ
jgi:hypothetical protein